VLVRIATCGGIYFLCGFVSKRITVCNGVFQSCHGTWSVIERRVAPPRNTPITASVGLSRAVFGYGQPPRLVAAFLNCVSNTNICRDSSLFAVRKQIEPSPAARASCRQYVLARRSQSIEERTTKWDKAINLRGLSSRLKKLR